MEVTVRPVKEDEQKRFLEVAETSFGDELDEHVEKSFGRVFDFDRSVAAFDGDDIVGTNGSFEFQMSVPGGDIAAAGVTIVGVLPTHRRRGVLSGMMRYQFDDLRARREPVAILWASESSIYQRFGYGIAALVCRMDIERDRAQFTEATAPIGRTRVLGSEEALLLLPEIYERVRADVPGMFARNEEWWDAHSMRDHPDSRREDGPLFRVVWEDDDGPGAYALYRVRQDWGNDGIAAGTLRVVEALATTSIGNRELWRFLFGIDLVARIRSYFRPIDDPLFHMLTEPRRLRPTISDGLWLRIIDLKGALEGRSYPHDAALTFEMRDRHCPWNEGRYTLESKDGEAWLREAAGDPEMTLAAEDLGACFLGGTSFATLARAGRVVEHAPGTALKADLMFASERAPFCPEVF